MKNAIRKIVDHSLNNINDSIVKRTATQSLAQAALQAPQEQPVQTVYGNGNGYGQYHDPNTASADPNLATSSGTYATPQASTPFSYSNGGSASVAPHQQASTPFDQQAYNATEDAGMTPSHAAALAAAAASGAPTQRPDGTYAYANAQATNNGYPPQYSANGVTDWHQWSRSNLQQVGPPGEYLNSATTLLALGGREGGAQGPGQDAAGAVEGSAMQGAGLSNYQWPGIQFGAGPNGHVGQQ